MSKMNKPKLSHLMKDELKLETKLTAGKIIWPIMSIILLLGSGVVIFKVYSSEKTKREETGVSNPSEKIRNKPEVKPEESARTETPKEEVQPVAAPTSTAPVVQTEDYTIVEGDTLGGIGTAKSVTLDEIMKANPGIVAENIQIGQVIKIPKKQ